MADPTPSIMILGFVFGFHIVLVNIDMGLAILIPLLKRFGETKDRPFYINAAKRYMKYLAIIYASAGVFATAFTVFLLSFFPEFIRLAGTALIVPFALAVIFISIRLLTISAYWYSWDKLRSDYHFGLGLILASTSFLIPFAFRLVFSFLNTPSAVVSTDPLIVDPGLLLTNPTFWPLYIKSILGGLALTMFLLVTVYTYRLRRNIGDKSENEYFIKQYLTLGMWPLLIQPIFGFWYLASLNLATTFKFSNVAGNWFGIPPQATDYSLLFALKLLMVFFQFFVLLYILWLFLNKKGEINFEDNNLQLILLGIGPAAVLTILFGELLNELSQLPYFIAVPSLESILPMINISTALNPLAAAFDIYALTIFAIVPLLAAFFVLLYYVLVENGKKKDTSEMASDVKE
ncbi:MAG: cytochrome ubiquinol oxidase subunit I [Promethearchaeota archaeon]